MSELLGGQICGKDGDYSSLTRCCLDYQLLFLFLLQLESKESDAGGPGEGAVKMAAPAPPAPPATTTLSHVVLVAAGGQCGNYWVDEDKATVMKVRKAGGAGAGELLRWQLPTYRHQTY